MGRIAIADKGCAGSADVVQAGEKYYLAFTIAVDSDKDGLAENTYRYARELSGLPDGVQPKLAEISNNIISLEQHEFPVWVASQSVAKVEEDRKHQTASKRR